MLTMDVSASTLIMIDFQVKLMPALGEAPAAIANALRLRNAAHILGVPALFTEQNSKRLGPTLRDFAPAPSDIVHKMTFDACLEPDFLARLPEHHAMIVSGWEAHVCVLQTVLSLIEAGRKVFVVRDAISSRRAESKETAVLRMSQHGAEIVTAEMVVFEWLQTAGNPRFREVAALIK